MALLGANHAKLESAVFPDYFMFVRVVLSLHNSMARFTYS